jgi:hypothetical protein
VIKKLVRHKSSFWILQNPCSYHTYTALTMAGFVKM